MTVCGESAFAVAQSLDTQISALNYLSPLRDLALNALAESLLK
jgi:hypothetical protein